MNASTSQSIPQTSRRAGVLHRYLTYYRLAQMSNTELERLFAQGTHPPLESLDGWEFRGWNTNPLTRPLMIRKFRKGFCFQSGLHAEGEMIGYNVSVRQNGMRDPHLALPNELDAFRHGYFLVTPYTGGGLEPHRDALLLDYQRGPIGSPLHPGRVLKDFVVQLLPDDPDLLLGKAYAQIGPLSVFVSFFVLERYNRAGR
ncbi:hypothetical protein L6R29_05055 [Myxococcota bacterium]|nr:hypothetical protein [Myxococcota bacterium]